MIHPLLVTKPHRSLCDFVPWQCQENQTPQSIWWSRWLCTSRSFLRLVPGRSKPMTLATTPNYPFWSTASFWARGRGWSGTWASYVVPGLSQPHMHTDLSVEKGWDYGGNWPWRQENTATEDGMLFALGPLLMLFPSPGALHRHRSLQWKKNYWLEPHEITNSQTHLPTKMATSYDSS